MIGEYRKFLEAEYQNRKFSVYERIYNLFDISLPIPKDLEKKFKAGIDFCHLRVTPKGVFSTAIFLPLIIFVLFSSIFYIIGLLSTAMLLLMTVLSLVIFYYLFSYTTFLTKYFRAKAAAEMSLAITYMSISLEINANLESAVAFAASNLLGPLGLDLKKILWDLETGSLLSVVSGLDWLSEKWKSENEEFVDAISLLKTAINQPPDMMDKNIKEAVRIMADGTKFRMKSYALKMRSPLRILNAFGILLPMLGLIFFPILVVFIPEIAKPELIAFSYTILFPAIVYLFLRQYFYSKPYSYHQVEIKNLEEFGRQKKIAMIVSLAIALVSASFLIFKLSGVQTVFSTEQFIYSFLVVVALSFSVILYSFSLSINNLKKNEEILKVESELPVSLFQLSVVSSTGKPIEKSMEDLLPRIKTLRISEMFRKILYNITTFGMTLDSAIFEKKVGAIYSYPSRIVSMAFRLVTDISKRGMSFLSMALKSMSEFLRDADEVSNATDEILSETTSDMQIQALIFAPLAAGIVVGLMAIVIYIFAFFGQSMGGVEEFLKSSGFGMSSSAFSFLVNMDKQIPFHYFQIIVGIYMIEIVFTISYFLGELNFGEDEVSRLFSLGKTMVVGIVIYSVTVCSLYFGISSLIKLSELGIV
jgi:hypothetical protein